MSHTVASRGNVLHIFPTAEDVRPSGETVSLKPLAEKILDWRKYYRKEKEFDSNNTSERKG